MKSPALPETWGGIECTINRLGNKYIDQLDLGNVYERSDYIDAVISLGIKTLRFPILWEKHIPGSNGETDWTWVTKQLTKLRVNNVAPIAGLLHHGSGPLFTNLLKKDFAEQFAKYAATVAETFPWITMYTPINEPLTTARFSGLYGYWYPHKKNDVSFICILLNELKATVLAMQEIKKINPAAKLVQTEDLGKTYSTPLLSYQADFENHRRWLTYDILTGRFNALHPLWNYFIRLGIEKDHLNFFLENPCPPDIIGVNHYVTSERYLDEALEKYPVHTHGGNTLHQYADIEMVRTDSITSHGAEALLTEVYDRYTIPIAVTEAHLNCSREEQLRWLQHINNVAVKLKDRIKIEAVTAWSLLGAFGWNRLLTEQSDQEYESGAFDISAGYPRPTALAGLIKNLAAGRSYSTNFLPEDGWWHLQPRLPNRAKIWRNAGLQPVLITDEKTALGKEIKRLCRQRNILYYTLSYKDKLSMTSGIGIDDIIKTQRPWAIIDTITCSDTDNTAEWHQQNALRLLKLSTGCKKHNIKLACYAEELVSDGANKSGDVATDLSISQSLYRVISEADPTVLIIRPDVFFGAPAYAGGFINNLLLKLKNRIGITAPDNLFISPAYLPHLANASLDLLIDDAAGPWHIANKGSISWFNFIRICAAAEGLDDTLISPGSLPENPAEHLASSVLTGERYSLLPSLDNALREYCHAQKIQPEKYIYEKV